MLVSPFTNILARKLDLRMMLAIGMALFVVAMYLTAGLTNQEGFAELFVPQVVRGIALMFCYLPANLIALGTLPPEPAEERGRALQSDAQSRRRDRARDDRHDPERPAAISTGTG